MLATGRLRKLEEELLTGAEWIADGAVHAVGIFFSIAAGSALLALAAFHTSSGEYLSLVLYVVALVTLFSVSCAYNLWPLTPAKQVLRRFDHAAIYLLIAGTYTPFFTQLPSTGMVSGLLVFVWLAAATGILLKLLLPGRFDRLAVAFYLLVGWSGLVVFGQLIEALTATAIWLMLAGGIVYSAGVVFFAWRSLKFQTPLWHGFVVAGAVVHFAAISDIMVFARLA